MRNGKSNRWRQIAYSTLLLTLALTFGSNDVASAFDTFEHIYLGEAAYRNAISSLKDKYPPSVVDPFVSRANAFFTGNLSTEESGLGPALCNFTDQVLPNCDAEAPAALKSALQDIPLSFGDLSGLAGDYAGDVPTLKGQIRPYGKKGSLNEFGLILAIRQQLVGACHWLHQQADTEYGAFEPSICFKRMVEDAYFTSSSYAASRLENAALERIPGYVSLASTNQTHFPTHSWAVYQEHHDLAIKSAQQYAQNNNLDSLYQALLEEGFAQHFLQDSFSAGHIGSAWGSCRIGSLFCDPARAVLQHNHDTLNAIGVKVVAPAASQVFDVPVPSYVMNVVKQIDAGSLGEEMRTGWIAFGDDHLFAKEAAIHRTIVVHVATESVLEVLEEALNRRVAEIVTFPVLADCEARTCRIDDAEPCATPDKPLCPDIKSVTGSGPIAALPDLALLGAPDYRVARLPLEGWKVLVSAGGVTGHFNELNRDGTVDTRHYTRGFSSYELGYVRSVSSIWNPNYFGAGAEIVHAQRTMIFPFSFGWWFADDAHFYFGGLRSNLGVRLDDANIESNPSDHTRASFVASFPVEFGVELYPPLAIYLRTELATVTLAGVADRGSVHFETESLFTGEAPISLGVRWDLFGIL